MPAELLEAHRILKTINAIKKHGFNDIGVFFTALLLSEDRRISKVADNFVQGWFITITSHMLRRSKWGAQKRRTVKSTNHLSAKLGKDLIDVVLRILSAKLGVVTTTPFARISPREVCIMKRPRLICLAN